LLLFDLSEYGLKPKGDYDTARRNAKPPRSRRRPNMDSSRKAIMTAAFRRRFGSVTAAASEYGLKPKGDYDLDLLCHGHSPYFAASEYGLKPKGDYDLSSIIIMGAGWYSSEYGLKPKGDYDFDFVAAISAPWHTQVRIWTQAERRL